MPHIYTQTRETEMQCYPGHRGLKLRPIIPHWYSILYSEITLSWSELQDLKSNTRLTQSRPGYVAIKPASSKTVVVLLQPMIPWNTDMLKLQWQQRWLLSLTLCVTIPPFAKSASEFRQELDGS